MTTLKDLLRDFASDVAKVDIEVADYLIKQYELIASGKFPVNTAKLDANQIRNNLIEEKLETVVANIKERIVG